MIGTCFRNVVLRLVPCVLLLLLSPIELLSPPNRRPVRWSLVIVSRILTAISAAIICTAELVQLIVSDGMETHAAIVTLTPFLLMLSHLWSAFLLLRAKKRSFVRCGVVWIFVAVSAVFSAFDVYFMLALHEQEPSFRYYTSLIFLPVILVLLLLCSIADSPVIEKEERCSPRDLASFPSRFTFSWVNRIAFDGWRKVLDIDDLHPLVDADRTEFLSQKLGRNLKVSGGVTRALFRTFGLDLLHAAVFKCCMDWSDFMTPLLLRWLLSFASDQSQPHWHGYVIACLMLCSTMTYNIAQNTYFDLTNMLGIRIRTALMTCIYKKALTISNSARRQRTVGEIVNLMSVDADRFRPLLEFLHISWAAFIQISIAIFLLYQELGYSALAGVLVLLLVMPFNTMVSTRMEKSQKKQMKRKDERVKSMNEILNGMKVIKLYAWEQAFMDIVLKLRTLEIKHIRRIAYFNALFSFMWVITPILVSFCTFAVYILSDSSHVLNPAKVFFCLTIFNILRIPLINLPYLMSHLVACYVALKRLNMYFSSPDLTEYVTRDPDDENYVTIRNALISWSEESAKNEFHLDVDMSVAKGSLVAIVGGVGSGKTIE